MRAAFYDETGAAADVLQIGEVDDPVPGGGEVLVRVHTHGVNPTDCKRRAGQRGRLPFPRIVPGYDGAGMIEAVGAGVDPGRVGQRVWLWEAAHQKWDGAATEFVRLPASRAMALPMGASFADGASLGVPAITACHALMLGGPLEGETAIVTGASGAVCNYAVQLAKFMYRNIRLNGVAIFEVPEADKQRAAAFVQESLEASSLWHRVDSRYPLSASAEAHRRQETGRPRGKVLVET